LNESEKQQLGKKEFDRKKEIYIQTKRTNKQVLKRREEEDFDP
jgi:hypothetical protein